MRFRTGLLLLAALAALTACNLGRDEEEALTPNPGLTPAPTGKPTVIITSPQSGAEFVVDDPVLVSANAADSVGVTRVQLFANGQIVKTVSSESPSGDRNMDTILDYTPRATGAVTLRVLAYRGSTASDPAEIQISVKSSQAQVTAPPAPVDNVPQIDPNDPTCRALMNTGLNFRTGPGTNYGVISVLSTGTIAPIVGRLGDNSWWQVRVGFTLGWISAGFTTVYGNCVLIPAVTPPPTATPPGGAATNTPPPTATRTNTPTPTITSTPGKADLVVVSILADSTTLTIPGGQTSVTQEFTITISNTGSGPSRQFSNAILVLPGGSEADLGVVGNLNPSETIALTVDLTFDAPGSYTVRVTADSELQVDEVSEVNNTGSIPVIVN